MTWVVDLDVADLGRAELTQLTVHRHPDMPLLRRCWELYDGLYVALAEALEARLVTRDARLARGAAAIVDVALSK